MMNSYFEQSSFYNQAAAASAAGTAADQAYRFPLGLAGMGVSPYAQHGSNRSQDTPYDTATPNGGVSGGGGSGISPKSASLYSPLSDSSSYVKGASSGANGGADCGTNGVGGAGTPSSVVGGSVTPKDQQNGYSSLSKDLNSWGASATGAAAAGQTPVRPSVCTPDMSASRYTPTAVDVAARDRWMNTCSLSSAAAASQAAAAQPQLQQSANHHFYPWMAIAGKLTLTLHFSQTGKERKEKKSQ